MTPRPIILEHQLSLGDIVCMTAAVRALHTAYPGEFLTDVRTPFPDLWRHNPHITPIAESDGEKFVLDYGPEVNNSNQNGLHLIHGYCASVSRSLEYPVPIDDLRGDIHLSSAERCQMSIPHERFNCQRYWLVCAGGKNDFTVKHPVPETLQRVVDHYRGRIQFVQVGDEKQGHHHPRLRGVIDLVGKTSIRDLIHLVHPAQGIVCGITALVHLAAAVPRPDWMLRQRPCVVLAGGREPRTWYSYPAHRVLETVGQLACCAHGGCWHSRTVRIGGNDRLCERVINDYPQCQWMLRAEDVIRAIDGYLEEQRT